ncbi:rhomboid family intramembrane serine protease [Synoicihabitans lomoniglobus]|uniref:Rhomboid family intramembrane serine protease n=1 Tax=Synoicihabitans lomoniglobus TaxID=2909285 RepID=A0AAF0I3B6_9BACT|nr:rhomboid family intramembrane serine protease [Opitutaceae bacterium LMO-M01]WED66238.1 rhomboid family intramembrane serine protease [Opitutaceae bacterium LMO-M01]
MLSDRSYMRNDYARPTTSIITWIICATIAGFILQNVFWKWLGGSAGRSFDQLLALSVDGVKSGFIWTLFTYSLLHSMMSFLHIVFNMLFVFLLGRELLPLLGARRFTILYFGGVLVGGVFWLVTNWTHGGVLIGASAGVFALLMMFAALNPNRPITFLLFFIIPVTIKPKWLVIILGGIDLMGFLFTEIPGTQGMGDVAHSAHLGGLAAGWLFFRFVHQREWATPDRAPSMELPAWLRRSSRRAAKPTAYKVNLSGDTTSASATDTQTVSREDLRAEVDRILDKINSQGFGALTDREKQRLDEAKDLLKRG